MRLPSRWVTNPGSTLKAKSGPHSEVRSFFVPADMGRGCIGHPPARGTGPPVPAGGGRQASARSRAEENASFLSHPHTLRAPRSRAAGNKTPRPEEKRNARKGKVPKKEGRGAAHREKPQKGEERSRRDNAGETIQHTGKSPQKRKEKCRGSDAGKTEQERDDAAHREKAEPPIQGTRTTDSPKTPAPLKKQLPRKTPAPPRKTPAGQNQKENSSWSLS